MHIYIYILLLSYINPGPRRRAGRDAAGDAEDPHAAASTTTTTTNTTNNNDSNDNVTTTTTTNNNSTNTNNVIITCGPHAAAVGVAAEGLACYERITYT